MTLAFQGLLKAIMVMVVTTLRNTDTDANSHMQRVDVKRIYGLRLMSDSKKCQGQPRKKVHLA